MNVSKQEVQNAILFFAKEFGKEKNYMAMLNSFSGLPKTIEMIVYDMFLHKFNPYNCPEHQYQQYKLIYECATELNQEGYIVFRR